MSTQINHPRVYYYYQILVLKSMKIISKINAEKYRRGCLSCLCGGLLGDPRGPFFSPIACGCIFSCSSRRRNSWSFLCRPRRSGGRCWGTRIGLREEWSRCNPSSRQPWTGICTIYWLSCPRCWGWLARGESSTIGLDDLILSLGWEPLLWERYVEKLQEEGEVVGGLPVSFGVYL